MLHVGYINNIHPIDTNHVQVHVTCYMWGTYLNNIHPVHVQVTCYMLVIYCICTCGVHKEHIL